MLSVPCPGCKFDTMAPDTYLGQRVRCKKCGVTFTLSPQGEPGPAVREPQPAPSNRPVLAKPAGPALKGPYQYKMVPIPPGIVVGDPGAAATQAALHLERIVQDYASQGWEFYRVDTITVDIAPGCLAVLFGQRAESRHYYVITFRAPN